MREFLREQALGSLTLFHSSMQTTELKEGRLTEQQLRAVMDNDAMFLVGIIQAADCVNANNRWYSKPILSSSLGNYWKRFGQGIDNNALGELGHPDSTDLDIKNMSHRLVDAWWESLNLMGKLQIFHNKSGTEIRDLVTKDNYRPGVSSRSMGSLKRAPQGYHIVQEDLELIAWDLVAVPSAPGAFLSRVNESVTFTGSSLNESLSYKEKILSLSKTIKGLR